MTLHLDALAAIWVAYMVGRAMEAARHTPASPSTRKVRS